MSKRKMVGEAAHCIMATIQRESDKLEETTGMPSPFYACVLSSVIFETTLKAALLSKIPTTIHEKSIASVIQLLKETS